VIIKNKPKTLVLQSAAHRFCPHFKGGRHKEGLNADWLGFWKEGIRGTNTASRNCLENCLWFQSKEYGEDGAVFCIPRKGE
jgi:hypothetical protein